MPYGGPSDNVNDPWAIPNPDPTRHYRWISSDPRRLSLWLRSWGTVPGYSLVQGDSIDETRRLAEKLGFHASIVDTANRISFGFNVLADIPREEYERRVKEKVDEQLEKVAQTRESFHEAVDKIHGVKSFEQDPEEFEDRKKFNRRGAGERPFVGQAGRGASPFMRARRNSPG